MKTFGSLMEMGLHLASRVPLIALELEHGLDRVLATIEMKAKAEFGVYQPATGPFQAWPELADATKDDRVSQGYAENEPLLRSGSARDSISRSQEGLTGAVGSTDERLVWFEFGTPHMPARPVLGPAAFASKEAIEKLVGAAAVAGLIGADQVHQALGYDFTTKG